MTSLSSSLFMVLTFFCSHNFSKGKATMMLRLSFHAYLVVDFSQTEREKLKL